ncbi:MAG: hypothetical protein RLZZ69_3803 [Cyanobacteriota bacterium]|jgi:hypothetical protein
MEELLELEQCLLTSDIEKAIEITQELIEMSKADILRKIESYLKILLIHLIKQKVENRTTKSWNYSIKESSEQIKKINKRRKASGWYASEQELEEMCQNVFESAIGKASLEIFEGTLSESEIEEKINRKELIEKAIALIGN